MSKEDEATDFLKMYLDLCEQIDEDYKQLTKKKEITLAEAQSYLTSYERKWKDLESFYLQKELSKEVNITEARKGYLTSELKFIELKKQLREKEQKPQEQAKASRSKSKNKKTNSSKKYPKQSQTINYYTCVECHQNKSNQYYQHSTKNDANKFCSELCLKKYYAPKCVDCFQKCLGNYYHDEKYPELVYCPQCQAKKDAAKAQQEKENREWEERIDKVQDDLAEGLEKVASGEAEKNKSGAEEKLVADQTANENSNNMSENNPKVPVAEDNNSSKTSNIKSNMNNHSRERERESKINDLGETYKLIKELEAKSDKTPQEQAQLAQLKTELKKNKLAIQENNNHLIYWGLGIGSCGLISLVSFLVWKRRK